jgi:hypothetical protein
LPLRAPAKVYLQVVAEILNAMEFGMAADFLEASGQKRASWSTAVCDRWATRFLPTGGWFRRWHLLRSVKIAQPVSVFAGGGRRWLWLS